MLPRLEGMMPGSYADLAVSVCSVGWFVSLLVREEVLLAGLCERKILFQLKIYDRLRQATAKRTCCIKMQPQATAQDQNASNCAHLRDAKQSNLSQQIPKIKEHREGSNRKGTTAPMHYA